MVIIYKFIRYQPYHFQMKKTRARNPYKDNSAKNSDMGKRGQTSFEYIVIVGAIILLMIPFLSYAVSKINRETKFNTAEEAVAKLAQAADSVAVLGPGTRRFVTITLPADISATSINGTEILLQMQYGGKTSDIVSTTKSLVQGSLQKGKGTYKIAVEALNDGSVYIGSFNDTTAPKVIWSFPSGILDYFKITLQATTDENAKCRYASSDMAYASMSSLFNGSLLSHQADAGTLTNQSYKYYVRCQDTAGNTMNSSAIINFTLINNLTILNELPQVLLEAPANNSLRNFNFINFTYNVSSPQYNISSCTLWVVSIDNLAQQTLTKQNITENRTQSMITSVGKGNFTWWVNCTDTSPSARTGTSQKWIISVNTSGNDAFLTSCAGNCGFSGYSDGICRQSPAKCTQNNEVNIVAYDQFCTGGAQANTCCCHS